MQHLVFFFILKRHVVKNEFAAYAVGRVVIAVIQRFAVFLDDLHHPVIRDQPAGHVHDKASQAAQGIYDPDQQPGVSHVVADRYLAADGHHRAEQKTAQQLRAAENVGDRPEERVDGEQLLAAQEFVLVAAVEFFDLVCLAGECLHHAHAAQVLLQGGRKHRVLLLVGFIGFGDLLEENQRGCQDERHRDDREQRQAHIDLQQRDEVDDEEQRDAPDADGLVVVKAAQRVHVRGAALDQLAGVGFGMVGEGQVLDVVVEVIAQAFNAAFSGLGRQPAAQIGENALQRGKSQEAQRDQPDGEAAGLVDQVVVHKETEQQIGQCFGVRREPLQRGRGGVFQMVAI